MSGIIGNLFTFLRISITEEDPYLFIAHVIKDRLLLYHLVPVDFHEVRLLLSKKR